MRYCSNCHHTTAGEPLFCSGCGATYDVRLCPRLHVNSRRAQVCTQCGSRDLSEPQPPTPFFTGWRHQWLTLWPGLLLEVCSLIVLAAFVEVVIGSRPLQAQLIVILGFLGLCWWAYLRLPASITRVVSWLWRKGKRHDGSTH